MSRQLSQLPPRRRPDIDDEEEGERPESIEGHIQLKDITFAYPTRPELQIFKGFTLDVPAGSTVALVGESGSGKCVSLCTVLTCVENQSMHLEHDDVRLLRDD